MSFSFLLPRRLVLLLSTSLLRTKAWDPDVLSQRYRNWTYYPDWVIPPACSNPTTCPTYCNPVSGVGCKTDVMQLVQLTEEVSSGIFRAFYLQYDGYGYETYSAVTTDMVHFNLSNPGVVFSPRSNRPGGEPKPVPGSFDYASQTFVGPLLVDYNVSSNRVLRRATSNNTYWYSYIGFHVPGYESPPGADGFASSNDGINWIRSTPYPVLDTLPSHGCQTWEQGQIYAPFIIPAPDGSLASFYNAGDASGTEQSGAAYLLGGPDNLPGYDNFVNVSTWVRDPSNPTLPNDPIASYQASDPKVYYDDLQNVWVLIYFCNGKDSGGGADICIAFSDDQKVWSKASSPLYMHGGHPNGYDSCHAHKVWLTGDGGRSNRLYLYYTGVSGAGCDTRGILLLTSSPIP